MIRQTAELTDGSAVCFWLMPEPPESYLAVMPLSLKWTQTNTGQPVGHPKEQVSVKL